MNTTSNRFTTVLSAALLIAALPFGLAACATNGAADADRPSGGDAHGIGAKWSECMRDAGFQIPDADDETVASGTTLIPDGVDTERFAERASECSERLHVKHKSEADSQKWERQYAAVASCIRENGYADYPEQEPGSLDAQGYQRSSEPGFQETFDKCMQEHAPDIKTINPNG